MAGALLLQPAWCLERAHCPHSGLGISPTHPTVLSSFLHTACPQEGCALVSSAPAPRSSRFPQDKPHDWHGLDMGTHADGCHLRDTQIPLRPVWGTLRNGGPRKAASRDRSQVPARLGIQDSPPMPPGLSGTAPTMCPSCPPIPSRKVVGTPGCPGARVQAPGRPRVPAQEGI